MPSSSRACSSRAILASSFSKSFWKRRPVGLPEFMETLSVLASTFIARQKLRKVFLSGGWPLSLSPRISTHLWLKQLMWLWLLLGSDWFNPYTPAEHKKNEQGMNNLDCGGHALVDNARGYENTQCGGVGEQA